MVREFPRPLAPSSKQTKKAFATSLLRVLRYLSSNWILVNMSLNAQDIYNESCKSKRALRVSIDPIEAR